MIRKKIILALFSILIVSSCKNWNARTINESKHIKTTSELVQLISSDSYEGREPGSEGMAKATKFIKEYFETLEIQPYFNSYFDTLPVSSAESYNIVGVIESDNSRDEYILLGAHLDHLGKINRNMILYTMVQMIMLVE